MSTEALPEKLDVLAVGPHPDDLEITCGEDQARCDCCRTFRNTPDGVLPRALSDNKVRDLVLDRILKDGMNVEQTLESLRREFQTLALRVVAPVPGRIEWRINGESIGSVPSDDPLTWPLRPGKHRITAQDARGRVAETSITVR